MRKFFQVLSATALAIAAIASPKAAQALDLSGYVDTLAIYGYTPNDYAATFTVSPGLIGGANVATPQPSYKNEFTFAGAEVKLHGNQDFGDVASAGFSLSLASATNLTGASLAGDFNFDVQQAYVALNWDDVEFKMGRFYAPIGIESVDANGRATVTMGNVFAGNEPFYLSGFQITYGPDEGPGAFLFVADDVFEQFASANNNLDHDVGLGLGVTYGADDLSLTAQWNIDWTGADEFEDAYQLFDLSVLMENDTMMAGLDANFSMINGPSAGGAANDSFITGIEILGGVKMDDITAGLRAEYCYYVDDGALLGADGHLFGFTPFVTYTITEGVFARAEYRVDIEDLDKTALPTNNQTSNVQTVAFQLNASFE